MKATIYLPSGEARVLTEEQLFELHVLQERLMGLPVLCADANQAARVLGFARVQTLGQNARYVAFAGQGLLPNGVYEPVAFNPVAGAHLRGLGLIASQPCPIGPVLVIEIEPVPKPQQQAGQSYLLAF